MIYMPHSFDDLTFTLGNEALLRVMPTLNSLPPFSPEVKAFLDSFSRLVLRSREAKVWPDVISLGFWCRVASVALMQADIGSLEHRFGRGVVFHIAPGNVAVNFAYSLFTGLLAGNANVVRLPGRDYPQVVIVIKLIAAALEMHPAIKSRVCLVRYDKQKNINDTLSAMCDTRIIWGGDETIAQIRRSPLTARALDITFADRYSIALINAEHYLAHDEKYQLAQAFYNDTLLNDQNACSSPSLVVWLGKETERAREIFWHHFDALATARYVFEPIYAVNKLAQLYMISAQFSGVKKIESTSNRIMRVELPSLTADTLNWRGNCGFFLEYIAGSLDDINPICHSRCQTLAVFGVEDHILNNWLASGHRGVDRVVGLGHTLDFSLKWDGYDLISMLTRTINISM